jgi:selenocysteine-specific elongation factor
MHVVATAGHVDHGKSALVRALTGMEPDRWAEERRRGMTIDLGYAWTRLPGGSEVAFVDVPGHERFVTNMLAGVGPVPAAMFVVAADQGWQQQSSEHLAALHGLGLRHGLLVVTRSDLADPAGSERDALDRIAATCLGQVESVAVSARTGAGLGALVAALDRLVGGLPQPALAGRARLWVDRVFTVTGAGTVVTGTLGSGTIAAGDVLELAPAGRTVQVRGLQTLGRAVDRADAVARVAVNLRGVDRADVRRGDALVTPGAWLSTHEVDVRLTVEVDLPTSGHLVLHVGAAAIAARVRPFPGGTARLRLASPLPLTIGDRGLLRDPSRHDSSVGVVVLDPAPPPLRRRGAATRRAAELASVGDVPDTASELRRRGVVSARLLSSLGADLPARPVAGDWFADPDAWAELGARLQQLVERHHADRPLDQGLPVDAARTALGLPSPTLVQALAQPPLEVAGAFIRATGAREELPTAVAEALDALHAELVDRPFRAPEGDRLRALGLGQKELAAAERAGRLVRLTDRVVLLPDAPRQAAAVLAGLPEAFTVSQAGQVLDTSRRVAVPLLELLDREGVTILGADGTRRVRRPAP